MLKPTKPPKRASSHAALLEALRQLHESGQSRITAQVLADTLWPDARHSNAHGQTFNLAAGIAGRMLRRYRGCAEVEPRVWEIVPEFIYQTKRG